MPKKRKRVEKKHSLGPIGVYGESSDEKPKKKSKAKVKNKYDPSKRRTDPGKTGSYLTTKGQKKRILDEQTSYYME